MNAPRNPFTSSRDSNPFRALGGGWFCTVLATTTCCQLTAKNCTVSSILSFLEKLAVSVQSWASVNFLKSRQATTQQGIEASLTGYNVQETFSTRSQNWVLGGKAKGDNCVVIQHNSDRFSQELSRVSSSVFVSPSCRYLCKLSFCSRFAIIWG